MTPGPHWNLQLVSTGSASVTVSGAFERSCTLCSSEADVTVYRYHLLKTHQLPLDAFLVALKMMQVEEVDMMKFSASWPISYIWVTSKAIFHYSTGSWLSVSETLSHPCLLYLKLLLPQRICQTPTSSELTPVGFM
ncbi:hypothetical protein PHYPO_G00151500 [Pangasianodon hypophthalmus]|uniref:Uncharacterized protein n=1 Tax=Pangasianodon hypophthalmus TaxID=310915 RepID=A0A5N5K1N2_PANHP|nr:hypothetical protein PHYPO_G00151500 [Pangasianodon hypophthalmus]